MAAPGGDVDRERGRRVRRSRPRARGDVLTGIVAAFLAKGMDAPAARPRRPWPPTRRAGELADRGDGTIASDVLEALPRGPGRRPRRVSAPRALARIDLGGDPAQRGARSPRAAGGARLMAVVKADGYGHGAVPVARAALEGGATALAVATVGEAEELRAAGIDAPLLVMGPLAGDEWARAAAAGAEITVWTPEAWRRAAAAPRRAAPRRGST